MNKAKKGLITYLIIETIFLLCSIISIINRSSFFWACILFFIIVFIAILQHLTMFFEIKQKSNGIVLLSPFKNNVFLECFDITYISIGNGPIFYIQAKGKEYSLYVTYENQRSLISFVHNNPILKQRIDLESINKKLQRFLY